MLGIYWKITLEIKKLVDELEALNIVFSKYHPRPELLSSLRRQGILKSAVYSARIENISARIEDPQIHRKLEIQNLISAYNYIFSHQSAKKLSINFIRRLHRLILKNISPAAGNFRTEPWAVFNSAGIAIYLAPAHFKLPALVSDYVKFIAAQTDSPLVAAGVAQFAFEKIHPLADGNGRVGRLISALVMAKSGFGHVCESEEYLDTHRDEYYLALEPNQNCTEFIRFYLTGLVETAKANLDKINNKLPLVQEITLLPRRQEILRIIRDHPECTFDFIHRRFVQIHPSTLHYDLQQLQKAGLIRKLGSTRGAVYTPLQNLGEG